MKESEKQKFDAPTVLKKSEIKKMDLREGECACGRCNGWGEVYDSERDYIIKCMHCLGEGKLDWVENVTGKKLSRVAGTSGTSFNTLIGHQAGVNYVSGSPNVAIGYKALRTDKSQGCSKK